MRLPLPLVLPEGESSYLTEKQPSGLVEYRGLRRRNEQVKVIVGIDIQPIEEVETSLRIFGSRYRHHLFTDDELESCGDNSTTASCLAARFAAKEAVLKILDTQEIVPSWRSIEVKRTADGRPEIVLHGDAAHLARLQGIHDLSVSLSHAGGVAIATVVVPVARDPDEAEQ
jgi:holo-[acyl-carrier protein] synthase